MSTVSVLSVLSTLSELADSTTTFDSTKPQLRNFTVKLSKLLNLKPLLSTLVHLTELQNFTRSGSSRITVNRMECTLRTVSFSTTNLLEEEELSLLVKSRGL